MTPRISRGITVCSPLLKFTNKLFMKYRLGHIKQYAMWISRILTSWRTESSNISHETLCFSYFKIFWRPTNIFYFSKFFEDQHCFSFQNFLKTNIVLVFKIFWNFQNILKTDRQTKWRIKVTSRDLKIQKSHGLTALSL